MAATTDAAAGAASTTDGAAKPDGTTKPAADTTKPAGDKPADDGTKKPDASSEPGSTDDAAKPQSKAPEKYALTFPAGGYVDANDLTAIEALAREQDWTNEEAQGFVEQRHAAIKTAADGFVVATKADPTYGGAHFDETQAHVKRAMDKFRPAGTPRGDAFRALLGKSGYGNHLEVVSLLADLGKAMAEDTALGGGEGGGGETKDLASRIYGGAAG